MRDPLVEHELMERRSRMSASSTTEKMGVWALSRRAICTKESPDIGLDAPCGRSYRKSGMEWQFFLTSIFVCVLAGLFVTSNAAASDQKSKGQQREFVVGCASTVAYDPGGCRLQAQQKCKGEVTLVRILANTPLAATGLHHITARYRCRN